MGTGLHTCFTTEAGRERMKTCCQAKIAKFERAVKRCNVNVPVSDWCDGVPDGNEVHIGGRVSGMSPDFFSHKPTDACAALQWAKLDAPMVLTAMEKPESKIPNKDDPPEPDDTLVELAVSFDVMEDCQPEGSDGWEV